MMKQFKWLLTALLLMTLNPFYVAANTRTNSHTPFAIVELFTSEGCSSCPPAEALLNQLVKSANEQGVRIFPLAFHVDYWNYLSWVDQYSHASYTSRQRTYAQKLNQSSVYTPQMIVNGKHGFTGSRRDLAQSHIKDALKNPPQANINISIKEKTETLVTVSYQAPNISDGQFLHFALLESNIMSKILRGENSGKTLTHMNVVRNFKSIPLNKNVGEINLSIPESMSIKNGSIIAYIQNKDDFAILGATIIEKIM